MVTTGFTSNSINPIIDARLRLTLTAQGLAKKLGVSRQYISRAEAGTYTTLNPALVRWVSHALSVTEMTVTKLYQGFQLATRKATVEQVNPHKLERYDGNHEPGNVLFERWRAGYWHSPVAFANAFCIHPDTISRYEEGISKEMPVVIKTTLNQFGLLGENFELKGSDAPEAEATGARVEA